MNTKACFSFDFSLLLYFQVVKFLHFSNVFTISFNFSFLQTFSLVCFLSHFLQILSSTFKSTLSVLVAVLLH